MDDEGDVMRHLRNVLDQALRSPIGIRLVAEDRSSALRLRRQAYAARNAARKAADTSYDELSMVVTGRELWLVKRELCQREPSTPLFSAAELDPCRLPGRINVRGKARLGLRQALAVLAELSR